MSENIHLSGELVDILDPDTGQPTGEQLDKAIAHQRSLYHPDVHGWVTNGTHLLQQQRRWEKAVMPGQWDISLGEHVGAGESYLEAAIRGFAEELGLEVTADRLVSAGIHKAQMAIPGKNWVHKVFGDNFILVEPDLQPENLEERLTLQSSEVLAVRLYPLDQLEADIADPATASRHGEHPPELWQLGIDAIRRVMSQ